MVSSKLTEEEEFLKKQYQAIRNLKKELKRLNLKRKQEQAAAADAGAPNAKQKKVLIQGNKTPSKLPEFSSGNSNSNAISVPTSFNAAANTEKAKELLKAGAIHVSAEKKTTFKRSANLTRRLLEGNSQRKQPSKHFGAGSDSVDDDSNDTESPKDAKSTFKSFDEAKPKFSRREKKSEKKGPRRGNTLYVHGFAVNEKMIKKHFSKFGNIININMELDKNSGFVSFDTFEAADEAIKELDDFLVDNSCRLKVSLARHQPMINSVKQVTPWDGMTERSDKGAMDGESRMLVTYNDDIFSS